MSFRRWSAQTLGVAGIALWLTGTVARPMAQQSSPRLELELQDYGALPITADNTDQNTRAQLARVNNLRDEPGGRRFFVNDLNGPLYILDKRTKQFTTYLDFNGLTGHAGLFPKFTDARNFATGLINVVFDPDDVRNGVFYTLHMEDPATPGSVAPRNGIVSRLDLSGYTTTPAVPTPAIDGRVDREVVLVEWKDRDIANATFEGTAREVLRVLHPLAPHPLGEMTFNPIARAGDPDWRVMYLGAGDSQSGEQRDSRRLNPQRLDTLVGKILRIIPDPGEQAAASTVSENGRYRVPKDNPFVAIDGARKEIWASVRAQGRSEVTINDTGVQAENITSSEDGSIYFGSTAKGTIYRAAPGSAQAEPWIQASAASLTNVLGVLAHDKSNTLWVCQNSTGGRGSTPVSGQTALRSFDLKSGAAKGTACDAWELSNSQSRGQGRVETPQCCWSRA
jgi:hypothetical protein